MFGGNKVYGVHIVPGGGYRNNDACGTATGDNPETEYMIVAGDFYNSGCCFDYGNMERNSRNNDEGTMEAVYFGTCTIWGKGDGAGPWVMGDLEDGLWAGDTSPYEDNKPVTHKYVMGMVKGDAAGTNHWTIKNGNAQSGALEPGVRRRSARPTGTTRCGRRAPSASVPAATTAAARKGTGSKGS